MDKERYVKAKSIRERIAKLGQVLYYLKQADNIAIRSQESVTDYSMVKTNSETYMLKKQALLSGRYLKDMCDLYQSRIDHFEKMFDDL